MNKSITKITLFCIILLVAILSVAADETGDFDYVPTTHTVPITVDGLQARALFIFKGDSVQFQNNDAQEHVLIRVQGNQGNEVIALGASGTTTLTFNEQAEGFDDRIIYALDDEEMGDRVFITVKEVVIPQAPEGFLRAIVLVKDNGFIPQQNLIVRQGTIVYFINLDSVFHIIKGYLPSEQNDQAELVPGFSFAGPIFRGRDADRDFVYTLHDAEGNQQSQLTINVEAYTDTLTAIMHFIKEKTRGVIKTITDLFEGVPPPDDPLQAIEQVGLMDQLYIAKNNDKAIIGFTESKALKATNAKMYVTYKNVGFDVCAKMQEFRQQKDIREDQLECEEKEDHYTVTAVPEVYDEYWRDFTSKIRLTSGQD